MKEWILENTNITQEQYEFVINSNTVKRRCKEVSENRSYTLSLEHPINKINFLY